MTFSNSYFNKAKLRYIEVTTSLKGMYVRQFCLSWLFKQHVFSVAVFRAVLKC